MMSPRTPDQLTKIRQEKKKKIMDAALLLFAHKGYHSSSISQVAQKASISKGLIYNYFSSKEDLLKALLLKGFEELDLFNDAFPNGMDSKESMARVLDYNIRLVKENGTYWRLYFSLLMQVDIQKFMGDALEQVANPLIEKMSGLFKQQGCEDPLAEALLFGQLMDGIFINYLLNPEYVDLEKMKSIVLRRFGR